MPVHCILVRMGEGEAGASISLLLSESTGGSQDSSPSEGQINFNSTRHNPCT